MFARRPNPFLTARAFQAVAGVLGILLLLLQLVAPSLASAEQGEWMEICSEAGAVWVQVTPEDNNPDTGPCQDCAHCALCAVTAAAPLPQMPQIDPLRFVQNEQWGVHDLYISHKSQHLWPAGRGPPCAPQDRTERAPRASMASIQVTGGAPWS